MKNSFGTRNVRSLIITFVAVLAVAALPLLSNARTATLATSVRIVNNSSRTIRNVYLSPVDSDNWSGNQLGAAAITSGQSFNLSNVACDAQQIKVIAEDSDGCFLSVTIACGESPTWTITDDTARDCGN